MEGKDKGDGHVNMHLLFCYLGNKGTLLKTVTLQGYSFMLRNLHASASQIRCPGNPSPCHDPWNRRPEYLSE
jgi:hypothetical protein